MKSDMDTREKITIILLFLGLVLAILPLTGNRSFSGKPEIILSEVLKEEVFFSPDQVARFIVSEDSTVQIIDVRESVDSQKETFPSAVNIPYKEFVSSDPDKYLNNKNIRNVFIADDDLESTLALSFARGLGYENTFTMKGGMKEWKATILETKFTGDRISARENALFETRTRAAELYTGLNSLPDSLKLKFLESKKFSAKKLDGGCE